MADRIPHPRFEDTCISAEPRAIGKYLQALYVISLSDTHGGVRFTLSKKTHTHTHKHTHKRARALSRARSRSHRTHGMFMEIVDSNLLSIHTTGGTLCFNKHGQSHAATHSTW